MIKYRSNKSPASRSSVMTHHLNPPDSFPYLDVYRKGRPEHPRFDPFRIKHPAMDLNRRAKIFHPFDALKGFDEAISEKDILYTERRELSEEERIELDRRLRILKKLAGSSRTVKQDRKVCVSITYYVPCSVRSSKAFGHGGQYLRLSGICRYVDTDNSRTICIEDTIVRLEDVITIEIDNMDNSA